MGQREQVLAAREKRITHLRDNMESLEKQLKKHESGEKEFEDDKRIHSVKKRIQSYKAQLFDAMQPMSEDVSSKA